MAFTFPWQRMKTLRAANPLDGQSEPSFFAPPPRRSPGSPLLVFFHKWGETYRQYDASLAWLARSAGWAFLAPNYRGKNDRPEAAGSNLAQHDVLVAIDRMVAEYGCAPNKVCLAGLSGGGHMALLLASRYPARFAAVTVWSPITDLARWHAFHVERKTFHSYSADIERVTGGPPGNSSAVDGEFAERSPITFIHQLAALPVDINHGIRDGHQGHTISIDQSLAGFNRVADHLGIPGVNSDEASRLLHPPPVGMTPIDRVDDPTYGVPIYLRRHAGDVRLTIFEGAHDMISAAAFHWLKQHV